MASSISVANCPSAPSVLSTDLHHTTYITNSEFKSGTLSSKSLTSNSLVNTIVSNLLHATSIYSFAYLLIRHMASTLISAFNENQDIFKLLFIGGFIGFFRHFCYALWDRFTSLFFLTAHIDHPDEAYSWMMIWLSQRQHQQNNITLNAREVQVCTGNWGLGYHKDVIIFVSGQTTTPSLVSPGDPILHKTRLLSFLPAFGVKQWMKYRGTWMSVHRTKELGPSQTANRGFQYESLVVSLFTRDWRVLQLLLQEARDCYKSNEENLVCIYAISKDNFSWMRISEKAKRPLNTVILPSQIKTALLKDLKAFLASEKWYVEKGIPYRRGYLLHGVPGSGKSSLIHSIAGELKLSVYMVSLSIKELDDSTLSRIINQVPARSAIVFEDLDVLSPHRASLNNNSNDKVPETARPPLKPGSLTLSGLLNALDGLSAQEGRIIFATSNRYNDLDPALRRPGRLDRHFHFSNATTQQTKAFFLNFYSHLIGMEPEAMEALLQMQQQKNNDNHDDNNSPEDAAAAATDFSATITIPDKSEFASCVMSADKLEDLAVEFSEAIPNEMFSMALIQEYLVQYKHQPWAAVSGAGKWVEEETSRSKAF